MKSEERKCYNHYTDEIDTVHIITISDDTEVQKLIAPYAFLEQFWIISLPERCEVYFKKVDSLSVQWIYK